ncbi:MAG: pilus assembly protein CpaB [Solirubrobacteraceae bacterium]|jgi:pilus assembly protein CpaB|nr:pilus assembly protein CpaB [Solirubrobacteraceae bacterium]
MTASMSRRRRALLLGGLALVLGGLAASNVAGREAALTRRVGDLVDVVVAREPVAAGARIRPESLAVRRVPRRFAPRDRVASPRGLEGLRAAVDIAPGSDLAPAMLGDGRPPPPAGPALRPGERVAQVVALAPPDLVGAGSRVDVLVTPEPRPDGDGQAVLALEDVRVVDVAPAGAGATPAHGAAAGVRVAASLRVTLRQAVYLAAAQDFARELRLLPRADGDRERGRTGLRAGAALP